MTVKKYLKESIKVGDRELTVEVGRVAKQADGSCVIRYGDTMLLCAAVGALTPREGIDFFPLTIEYREAFFAAGRIPGNYFRREGRPNEKEVITCRLMIGLAGHCHRSYRNETQVVASVFPLIPKTILMFGDYRRSCALYLSDIPSDTDCRRARRLIDGRYVGIDLHRDSRIKTQLIVAGTEEAIVMVEAGAQEVPKPSCSKLDAGAQGNQRLCRWQKELYKALGIRSVR